MLENKLKERKEKKMLLRSTQDVIKLLVRSNPQFQTQIINTNITGLKKQGNTPVGETKSKHFFK